MFHDVHVTEATLMWLIATSARLVCSKLANHCRRAADPTISNGFSIISSSLNTVDWTQAMMTITRKPSVTEPCHTEDCLQALKRCEQIHPSESMGILGQPYAQFIKKKNNGWRRLGLAVHLGGSWVFLDRDGKFYAMVGFPRGSHGFSMFFHVFPTSILVYPRDPRVYTPVYGKFMAN